MHIALHTHILPWAPEWRRGDHKQNNMTICHCFAPTSDCNLQRATNQRNHQRHINNIYTYSTNVWRNALVSSSCCAVRASHQLSSAIYSIYDQHDMWPIMEVRKRWKSHHIPSTAIVCDAVYTECRPGWFVCLLYGSVIVWMIVVH